MNCPDCGCKFSEGEAVPVHGTNRYSNRGSVVAHECPMCGRELSERFTRERNVERCPHNAMVDNTEGGETCSECGAMFDLHGMRVGLKEAWAVPATDEMQV